MFIIRAVCLDHYISKPINELYERQEGIEQNLLKEWQEPVLRIFGSTADGIKACVHIHGVYPYIYVPYRGGENADRDSLLLGAALDEALRTSLNTKVFRFVHKVTLVSGIPLYGYHSKHRQFLKIYFYNPFHIRKAFDLLLSGAILGQKFQPHEAHIPYALQFMMDYNIYGMSFVTFSKVKYRRNPADPDSLTGVKEEDILSDEVKKMTWSRLEVDAWASDILNRRGQRTVGVNPGLQAIWEDEKERRRAQDRNSQITVQQSSTRPETKTHPTEMLYKARLAQKLCGVPPQEYEATIASGETAHSYPAEVPENSLLLEASAVDECVERPRVRESVGDVRRLVDEGILTQIAPGGDEEEGEGEEEEAEPEEEEEEEEEGVEDMTQPLEASEAEEGVICGAGVSEGGRGCSSGDEEATFWRNMADRIFQLDGAQESSSESELEAVASELAPVHSASDGCPELPSGWTSNIMSMLGECPTASAACPTPRTFWFDYSCDYLSQCQDAWISSKNFANFSDLVGKTQVDCLDSGDGAGGSKGMVPGGDFGGDFFSSSVGEYLTPSLPCSADSVVSPPSATSTLESEEGGPDIDLESICGSLDSPPREKRKVPSVECKFTESKIMVNRKPENEQQNVLQVLKSFAGRKVPLPDNSGHLTLKQYIKDCKEIVSVDFKNLCNREMIIIEYKPQNKKNIGNKYLMKPLDKFLESWNSAERKASSRKGGGETKVKGLSREQVSGEQNLRSNYVINVLEKRFSDASTVQSMSNKLTVKSMEILPDGGNCSDRCYNVNENVISRGEIKMKLIKSNSQGGKLEKKVVGGTLKGRRSEKRQNSDLKGVEARREGLMKRPRRKLDCSRENLEGKKKMKKCKEWSILPEPDTKLINEINSSFEEYFKSIVKRKHFYRKRKKNVIEKVNYEEEEEGEEEEEEEEEEGEEGEVEEREREEEEEEGDGDPMKLVTGFLSTFSQMPNAPPLSITIRLGRSRREKSKSRSRGGKKENSLVKSKEILPKLCDFSSDLNAGGSKADSDQEEDFIGDSDEERKRRRTELEAGSVTLGEKSCGAAPTSAFDVNEMRPSHGKATGKDCLSCVFWGDGEGGAGAEQGGLGCPGEPPVGPEGVQGSDSDDSRELKTRKWGSLEPGTSFFSDPVPVDAPMKHSLTQTPFPPLTLSGSPLFVSEENSSESDSSSSPTSDALVQSVKDSSPPGARSISDVLQNSEPFFDKRFLESSNLDDEVGGCVPSRDVPLNKVAGSKTIKPKRLPLDRKEVLESMQRYDIVESEDGAPFYGNPLDVSKSVDTGFKVLKIESRSGTGLKPFKGTLDVSGVEERRNASAGGQKTLRWRLVGNGEVTIVPLVKPPPRASVLKSSFFNSEQENLRKLPEKARLRMKRPVSPGQEVESEEEMEFSVTISNLSVEGGRRSSENADLPGIASPTTDARNARKKGPLDKIRGIKMFSGRSVSENSHSPTEEKRSSKGDNSFQIRGVTLDGTFGFSHSVENMENAKLSATHQYMSMLVVEVHVQTRKDLRPDPEYDPIRALFYSITFDSPTRSGASGMVVVGEGLPPGAAPPGHSVHRVPTEKALLEKLLALVREWDPEILAGYEIEMNSWGYLVQRSFVLEMNLLLLLGRVQCEDFSKKSFSDFTHSEEDGDDVPRSVKHMRISGRIVLDAWRVLRHEVALTSYSFENVMYHLSQERHSRLSYEKLSYYWEHPSRKFRHLVVEHFATRVLGLVRILDQLDFINRTSELSRLFGIQFHEVLSRGSQFRVESMMLRLAKPLNYVAVSPSVSQRASMRAPASLPLILEPESLFYTDPVIVLDFQSLYPSIIIAYNYCFSTCLGRVEKLGGREPFEFGCTQLQISPEELKSLEDDLTISPAGIAFVKSNIRKGVLPAMLEEILEARLMVKKSMKENKDDKVLQKVLFARQLGLKLIANVTYGYTAANFSGRMPCIEVGDSVVSKGRETLHRAIQLVKNTREWGAKVIYGDTDSIFVLTPGRSREEAFRIGAEIAEAVTRDNPKPVKLKLEKVYQPSILQTKKRYVGYMFESPDQGKPVFEAKGIETVRRDGCPATGKILEKALRILFDTRDVSLVKKYTVRQFSKLYQGRVNVHDLIFAKEYRGRKGYRTGACVPALHLAKQWTQRDRRAEPRVKERVPYVVVSGPPGVPLIRLVRSPADVISNPALRINAAYYITKVIIPPLQRCFSLLGVDVTSWYAEMPRRNHRTHEWSAQNIQKRSTISQYFAAAECVVCSVATSDPVCPQCEKEPQALAVVLKERIRRWQRCHDGLTQICRSCCRRPAELDCVSLDCPVLFRRNQAGRDEEHGLALLEILTRHL